MKSQTKTFAVFHVDPPTLAYAEFHCLSSAHLVEERHTFGGVKATDGKKENSFFFPQSSVKCAAASEEKLFNEGEESDFEGTHKGISEIKKKGGERIIFYFFQSHNTREKLI